jgi:hypothetical protein
VVIIGQGRLLLYVGMSPRRSLQAPSNIKPRSACGPSHERGKAQRASALSGAGVTVSTVMASAAIVCVSLDLQ